ncbi:MAG: hypothetical protein KKI08_03840 [Armatimonadetes bacterium]|nr:hypothetical protein [Armatimonadota bacterium]
MELAWLGPSPRTPWEELLCRALDEARQLGIGVWLYGGYAVEAWVGRPLRAHGDVDFLVWREDWPALAERLAALELDFAYHAPTALHLRRAGRTLADVLLAELHPDGFPCIEAPLGYNPLPPGSLGEDRVTMWGRRVAIVTLECLLVMKASGNFLEGDTPGPNPKHRSDLDLIMTQLGPARVSELAPYFTIHPHQHRPAQSPHQSAPPRR